MISIWFDAPEGEQREWLIAELWEAGTLGVTEEDGGVRAFFAQAPDVSAWADFHPVIQAEDDHDWVEETRRSWPPFAAGARLWVAPEWNATPAPAGRLRLVSYPGMACGTGDHPATRLCLEALDSVVQGGERVLDVGAGSGLLAHAACLLGAGFVAACDIDPAATLVALQNTRSSHLDVHIYAGSLRCLRDRQFDVMVGNLNAATLAQLAPDLRRVLRENGSLIVSGFREDEAGDVRRALSMADARELELDGWSCLINT